MKLKRYIVPFVVLLCSGCAVNGNQSAVSSDASPAEVNHSSQVESAQQETQAAREKEQQVTGQLDEEKAWSVASGSKDPDVIRKFIDMYPNSSHVKSASLRLKLLEKRAK